MALSNQPAKLYGLLGRNIGYSLSPAMHNAAFRHFGISAEYKIFDIAPDGVEVFFRDFVLGGKLAGLNVTVPYKVTVRDMLDKVEGGKVSADHFLQIAGAVNTIRIEGERISAFNTDGEGFYVSLKEDAGFDPKGKDVFILGSGGAGRVIALYLSSLGDDAPKKIRVSDIADDQLKSLRDTVGRFRGSGVLSAPIELGKGAEGIEKSDLVVNATPLGTKEGDAMALAREKTELLKKKTVVYDLVYARETELVRFAREKGLRAFTGEGMLAGQGALAFEKWTGKPLGEIKPVMKKALMEALGRK